MNIRSVSWPVFKAYMAKNWQQGEHLSIIGPTGRGKTVLLSALMELRQHVLFFATKPRDDGLSSFFSKQRYGIARDWRAIDTLTDTYNRICLWPEFTRPDDAHNQEVQFRTTIDLIFSQGGWTVAIDETYYLSHRLGLKDELIMLWTQGRSLKITVVAATQRPKNVPLEMYDQATHIFFFRFADQNDIDRIGDINVANKKDVTKTVAELEAYEFLYINTVTGERYRSRVTGVRKAHP